MTSGGQHRRKSIHAIVPYTQNKWRTILSLKKEPMLHILNNPLESQKEKGSFVTHKIKSTKKLKKHRLTLQS